MYTIYYRIERGRVGYKTLYVAWVTGPYTEIIGWNGAGPSISDATEELKRQLKVTRFSDCVLVDQVWQG